MTKRAPIPLRRRSKNAPAWMGLEALEDRRLLAALIPTALDQYLVEVINRDRADPNAAAARYGIDLNEGPPKDFFTHQPFTITSTPKQPLAFNFNLTDAAQKHSQWMTDNDNFTHFEVDGQGNPIPGFNQPQQRAITAGYSIPGGLPGFENIAAQSQNNPDPLLSSVISENSGLFIDSTTDGRGHRINIMTDNLTEIGLGMAVGPLTYQTSQGPKSFNSLMLTEDFAANSGPFLTGVVYRDNDANNFYTPGEGVGNITITATPVGGGTPLVTTTWAAGGFTLKAPNGSYNISAVGPGFDEMVFQNVSVSGQNVKVDFIKGAPPPAPAIAVQQGAHPALVNGDSTPSVAEGTDFGAVVVNNATALRTFTIKNTGHAPLNLTGNPKVTISGANAADFTVIALPTSPIAAGASSVFQIQFDPSDLGPRTAVVSIASDDLTQSPFSFTVDGVGAAPDLVGQFLSIIVPDTLVPGSKFKAVLMVTNQGDAAAAGPLTLKLHASTNTTLDSDTTDPVIATLSLPSVKIPVNGFKLYTFNVTLGSIPPNQAYFLLGEVDSAGTISESNETNNVAVSPESRPVVWQFGHIGAGVVPLTLGPDSNGTTAILTLKGAGIGTVIPNGANPPDVVIDGADATTTVAVVTKKSKNPADDGQVTVRNVTINGSAKSLLAPNVIVVGNVLITGAVTTFAINDIADPTGAADPNRAQHTLTIGGTPLKPTDAVTLAFDQVAELTISSPQLPIKALTAVSWTDRNATPDVVTAPRAAAVTIKGDKKRGILGVFESGMTLTDAGAPLGLGALTVADAVGGAVIRAASKIGAVTVGALLDSTIYAGVADSATGLPAAVDLGVKTLAALTVKGLPSSSASFLNSFVAAGSITKVLLHDVQTANSSVPMGFVSRKYKSFKRLDAPASVALPAPGIAGDADLNAGDDFVIRVVL